MMTMTIRQRFLWHHNKETNSRSPLYKTLQTTCSNMKVRHQKEHRKALHPWSKYVLSTDAWSVHNHSWMLQSCHMFHTGNN